MSKKLFIKKEKLIKKTFLTLNLLIVLMLIYNLYFYFQDKNSIRDYINILIQKSIIDNKMNNYIKAIAIRDYIKSNINTNLGSCKFFNLVSRPLWGYRVKYLLKYKEGQCGEGSRLLINIFNALNIPSRKVYLFGNENMHAVVEIFDGKDWILIDTINSPKNFREFTMNERKGINDYFYTDHKFIVTPKGKMLEFDFFNYSYFNWNKIFNNRLVKTEIYMHNHIFDNFQIILENPPLFFALSIFIFLIVFNLICVGVRFKNAHC